eukprot:TRINITY_DN26922_c0_g1_i1.p1 TRINITY_DN26922_c0_g1~~TRINITY_DN26922_c0_g1_i1.p1  ORF type:complete len:364 (+),score=84.39 TRINITY_DN26922_c0_g1_i1:68-1159(+)
MFLKRFSVAPSLSLIAPSRTTRRLFSAMDSEISPKNISTVFTESPVKFGNIEINSPLGIGTWSWGDRSTWGYETYDKSFNRESIQAAFLKCMESGVNFFDTAEVYGQGVSETLLGSCVNTYRQQPDARKVVVATKFLPLPWRLFQGSLASALDESLQRLAMPSVDLYQIHAASTSLRAVEVWAEALAEAHAKGLIKAVGVSNYNADQVRRTHAVLAKHGVPLASNQIEFSLLRTNPLHNGLIDACKELGVQIIAYSPLAMGRLSGKYSKENPPQGNRKFGKVEMEELEPLLDKLKAIGVAHGKTPSQVALNWCICKGTVPIVGVKNAAQATENIAALGWRLTADEVASLDAMSRQGPANFWQE